MSIYVLHSFVYLHLKYKENIQIESPNKSEAAREAIEKTSKIFIDGYTTKNIVSIAVKEEINFVGINNKNEKLYTVAPNIRLKIKKKYPVVIITDNIIESQKKIEENIENEIKDLLSNMYYINKIQYDFYIKEYKKDEIMSSNDFIFTQHVYLQDLEIIDYYEDIKNNNIIQLIDKVLLHSDNKKRIYENIHREKNKYMFFAISRYKKNYLLFIKKNYATIELFELNLKENG